MRQVVSELMVDSFTVRVTRKRMKNIYLRVLPPDGEVTVSAPFQATDAHVAKVVRKQRDWILQQQRTVAQAAAQRIAPYEFSDGLAFPIFGSTFTVRVDPAIRKPVIKAPYVLIPGRKIDEEVRRVLKDHLRGRVWELIEDWGPVIGRTPRHVTVKKMTSRWGSCNRSRWVINLNSQLVFLPEQFLIYVLVHEMTHLWVGGHGKEFYSRMDATLPQWKKLRRELNDLGARVL